MRVVVKGAYVQLFRVVVGGCVGVLCYWKRVLQEAVRLSGPAVQFGIWLG